MLLTSFYMTLSAADTVKEESSPYSIRLGAGYSDLNNLGAILIGDWNRFEGNTYVVNTDFGYRFFEDLWGLPLDFYAKGGLSYFNEQGYQDNFLEATLYAKFYWKLDFWKNRVRVGYGQGLSLAEEVPVVETIDATNSDGTVEPTAKFLNYLDISLDLDIGRLIRVESIYDLYIGYTLKHRSGVFGTFNGVRGGSNYNMLTLEKNY